jgi:hypothetical protein
MSAPTSLTESQNTQTQMYSYLLSKIKEFINDSDLKVRIEGIEFDILNVVDLNLNGESLTTIINNIEAKIGQYSTLTIENLVCSGDITINGQSISDIFQSKIDQYTDLTVANLFVNNTLHVTEDIILAGDSLVEKLNDIIQQIGPYGSLSVENITVTGETVVNSLVNTGSLCHTFHEVVIESNECVIDASAGFEFFINDAPTANFTVNIHNCKSAGFSTDVFITHPNSGDFYGTIVNVFSDDGITPITTTLVFAASIGADGHIIIPHGGILHKQRFSVIRALSTAYVMSEVVTYNA